MKVTPNMLAEQEKIIHEFELLHPDYEERLEWRAMLQRLHDMMDCMFDVPPNLLSSFD